MQVKRYEVASMNEAMNMIKNDFGPDAIILSARKIHNGKPATFEVMAAHDTNPGLDGVTVCEKIKNHKANGGDYSADVQTFLREELKAIRKSIESLQQQNSLASELAEIKETMNGFFDVLGMRKGRIGQDLNAKLYLHLLGNGFSRASACHIVDAVNRKTAQNSSMTETEALLAVQKHIGNTLPVPSIEQRARRIKMIIGPTGVGKTTTLAKLAARYSIQKKRKVGLITTDNFRIAAAEQLETYARIMGLRMEKASTPETFSKALKVFADRDVILIDTPGRAHPDGNYLCHLHQVVPDQSIETNLLVSSTGNQDYFQNIISNYSMFSIDHLIITKIDESGRLGTMYDMIKKIKKPVTYVTCGQNVPQDIEETTPASMAKLMMKCVPEVVGSGTDYFTG